MLLTLLSMLGGGFMRMLPELMSFLNRRQDNQHELALLDRQVALEQTKSKARLDEIGAISAGEQAVASLGALQEALGSQMKPTGIRWVDALNFLVRPLVTYYFLLLYGIAKVSMFILMLQAGTVGWEAIVQLYTEDDKAMLSGILAFWFVGRVIDKK